LAFALALPIQEHERRKRSSANQRKGERARHTPSAEAPEVLANTARALALDDFQSRPVLIARHGSRLSAFGLRKINLNVALSANLI